MSRLAALPPTITSSWLAMQCRMIPGVVCAAVFPAEAVDTAFPVPSACWPSGSEKRTAGLRVVAGRAISQNDPLVCRAPQPSDTATTPKLSIACPILIDGVRQGIIVVEMKVTDEQRQRAVLQMLQWGSMWLQFTLQQETGGKQETGETQETGVNNDLPIKVLNILAASLEHSHFQAAATACATELANSLQCERVSIGFRQDKAVTLQALSNSANFDGQTNLARALELAMTEAVEQQATIAYPDIKESAEVVNAHSKLCQQHNTGSICTVPLSTEGSLFGAMSFERLPEHPIDAESIKHFEVIAAFLGPILELKRELERHPLRQLWDSTSSFLYKLLGPSHPVLKASGVILFIDSVSSSDRDYSIREVGSSYTTTNWELEVYGNTMFVVHLDGADQFEAYIQDANVKIYLIGQTKGSVAYFTDDITVSDPLLGSWQELDADSYGIPDSATGLFLHVELNTGVSDAKINFRHGDSTDDWNGDIGGGTHFQAAVGLRNDNVWDQYMEHAFTDVYIAAYTKPHRPRIIYWAEIEP